MPKRKKRWTGPRRNEPQRPLWDLLGYTAIPVPGGVFVLEDEARRRRGDFLRLCDDARVPRWLTESGSWAQWDALVAWYGEPGARGQ